MRILICCFFGFMFSNTILLLGQKKNYDWGYIITKKEDTIHGWISDRKEGSFAELFKKIRFKEEGKLFKRKFTPNQIMGYGYLDSDFVSLPLQEKNEFFKLRYYLINNSKRQFLKVVKRTECLHYYLVEFIQENNYIESFPLFYIPGTNEMVRVTQGIFGMKKKRLAEYFNHCPDLVQAIEKKKVKDAMEVYEFYCQKCN